jgi:exodeoxyribonuclease VII small subunit
MSKEIKYSEAIDELESIVKEIENEEITIDQMSEKVKRASELIAICKNALNVTEDEVKGILDELEND